MGLKLDKTAEEKQQMLSTENKPDYRKVNSGDNGKAEQSPSSVLVDKKLLIELTSSGRRSFHDETSGKDGELVDDEYGVDDGTDNFAEGLICCRHKERVLGVKVSLFPSLH
jgi:hypothetical protein